MKQQSTLRSLATMRVRIDLRRQENNLSKHYREFELEYRADQRKVYRVAFDFINSTYFSKIITVVIIFNTIILAMDKYPEDQTYYSYMEKFNTSFSCLFMIEMIIKLVAFGFKGYIRDPYNIYDCLIVFSSIADILMSQLLTTKSPGIVTAIRSFRLLRLFKLAREWRRLSQLLTTIVRTFKDVGTFSILMFLFMFVFSLLGMNMYAFKVKFAPDNSLDLINGESPESNFDTLLNAFATVFVVLTADGWSAIYFAHYRAYQSEATTFYFITLIILG